MRAARNLSRSQLREITAELESERARLERSLLDSALLERAQTRHDAVVAALRRLADGGYGVCVGCQQPIPFGRLLVMPETTHCVGCGVRA